MLNAYGLRPEILPNRHPPDDGLVEAEIAACNGFWQCQTLDAGLWCTQAGDIGAPSAENADLVVVQSPLVFDRTQNNRAPYAGAGSGGGRSSAINRRMSPNKFPGMATSAIWKQARQRPPNRHYGAVLTALLQERNRYHRPTWIYTPNPIGSATFQGLYGAAFAAVLETPELQLLRAHRTE